MKILVSHTDKYLSKRDIDNRINIENRKNKYWVKIRDDQRRLRAGRFDDIVSRHGISNLSYLDIGCFGYFCCCGIDSELNFNRDWVFIDEVIRSSKKVLIWNSIFSKLELLHRKIDELREAPTGDVISLERCAGNSRFWALLCSQPNQFRILSNVTGPGTENKINFH